LKDNNIKNGTSKCSVIHVTVLEVNSTGDPDNITFISGRYRMSEFVLEFLRMCGQV